MSLVAVQRGCCAYVPRMCAMSMAASPPRSYGCSSPSGGALTRSSFSICWRSPFAFAFVGPRACRILRKRGPARAPAGPSATWVVLSAQHLNVPLWDLAHRESVFRHGSMLRRVRSSFVAQRSSSGGAITMRRGCSLCQLGPSRWRGAGGHPLVQAMPTTCSSPSRSCRRSSLRDVAPLLNAGLRVRRWRGRGLCHPRSRFSWPYATRRVPRTLYLGGTCPAIIGHAARTTAEICRSSMGWPTGVLGAGHRVWGHLCLLVVAAAPVPRARSRSRSGNNRSGARDWLAQGRGFLLRVSFNPSPRGCTSSGVALHRVALGKILFTPVTRTRPLRFCA